MKTKLLLFSLLIACVGTVWAQGPNNTGTYYQSANGKSGMALKTAMHTIIKQHTNIGYNGLWTAYYTTDQRADGYLRDWYSCTTNYVIGGDKQGNSYKKEGDSYNREHTVPQNWFNEASPMKADVVHVVPTDGYVNNRRGSYPFGEVNNIDYQSNQGYSKLGSCKSAGYNGTVFEPNDEIKGDIARIYFYMATCYQDKCGNWGGNIFTSTGLVTWEMNVMKAWSEQDPIDDVEIARNNAVYEVQGNRNPFVDYPGLENYIWGDKTDVAFSYDNYNGGAVSTIARPVFSPDAGTYYNQVEITISSKTAGATIYYTTNGEDASEQSLRYEGPITLTESATIKAVAIKDGERSAQSEAAYTIKQQGGGGETPVDCEIILNNEFFGTSINGVINSNNEEDFTGTQDGVEVVYALGTGSQRMITTSEVRLYEGNKITFSVSQGAITKLDFTLGSKTSALTSTKGSIDNGTWTGNESSVTLSSTDKTSLKSVKISVAASGAGIDQVQTNTLSGQRVIYNLRGQRVANPTHGIYIVDGRKVIID